MSRTEVLRPDQCRGFVPSGTTLTPIQEDTTPVNVKIGLWLACGVCCQTAICTEKAACLWSMHGCSRGPTRQAVAFLSHGNMAHPLVVGVGTEV